MVRSWRNVCGALAASRAEVDWQICARFGGKGQGRLLGALDDAIGLTETQQAVRKRQSGGRHTLRCGGLGPT